MTPAEKDAAVLAVLKAATKPLTPYQITRHAKHDHGIVLRSFDALPACARINAVRHPGGKYTAPQDLT